MSDDSTPSEGTTPEGTQDSGFSSMVNIPASAYSDTPDAPKGTETKETAETKAEPSDKGATQEEGKTPNAEKVEVEEPKEEVEVDWKKKHNQKDGLLRNVVGSNKKLKSELEAAKAASLAADKALQDYKAGIEGKGTTTKADKVNLDVLEGNADEKQAKILELVDSVIDVVEKMDARFAPIEQDFQTRQETKHSAAQQTVDEYVAENKITAGQLQEMAIIGEAYKKMDQHLTMEELHRRVDPNAFMQKGKPVVDKSDVKKAQVKRATGTVSPSAQEPGAAPSDPNDLMAAVLNHSILHRTG